MIEVKRKHLLLVIIFSVFFIAVTCFVAILFYQSFHFLPHTYINNMDVSYKTVDEVTLLLNESKPDYSFTLVSKDKTYNLSSKDLKLDFYISKGEVQHELTKQSAIDFIAAYFLPDVKLEMDYSASFDEDALYEILDSYKLNKDRKHSMNASMSYAHGIPKVSPEIQGDYLDRDLLYSYIKDSIVSLVPEIDIDDGRFYIPPEIVSADLQEKQKNLEKALVRDVKLRIVSLDVPVESLDIHGFSIIDDDVFQKYDSNKVNDYVERLADAYNSAGGTHTFKTSAGNVIEVEGGTYGYNIDVDKTSEALFAKLSDLSFTGTVDVVYSETGYKDALKHPVTDSKKAGTVVGDDIGNTYIEISIDKQHMWLYVDGKKITETDVVTGNDTADRATPTGVYYVYNMSSPATLVGDDYRTEVKYWMALTYSGVGIHDSTWRSDSEYGGTTYQGNGSHGCINTPYDIAEKIYKTISPGIPVVIY